MTGRRCRAVLRLAAFRAAPRCTLREGHGGHRDHLARLRLPLKRVRFALVNWPRRYRTPYTPGSLGDWPPWQRREEGG